MPIGFLSDAERERLDSFPAQVVPGDIETYFTLSRADRRQIPRTTSAANRLGFALQLGTLRFLGFCPDDLSTMPEAVVAFVAKQFIEVDGWTRFSDDFEHAAGTEPRSRELRAHLYAAVLAQACNLGLTRMARISDLTYQKLAWCTNWYVRDEPLKAATTRLVNFQYHQPLSRFWGSGTLSSPRKN